MKELLGKEGLKRRCRGYTDETCDFSTQRAEAGGALETSLAHKAKPCLWERGTMVGLGEERWLTWNIFFFFPFLKLCLLFVRGDGFCAWALIHGGRSEDNLWESVLSSQHAASLCAAEPSPRPPSQEPLSMWGNLLWSSLPISCKIIPHLFSCLFVEVLDICFWVKPVVSPQTTWYPTLEQPPTNIKLCTNQVGLAHYGPEFPNLSNPPSQ